ncbi:MAG: phosphoribosyltransferase family protein [Bacteroidota bacterium]|nr:phosphoribosyltransferase family protein [Candidatus Kapabacteria bacterium]MCX7937300.1 phosphoribosyltransferase family protein [Chlorobiota bacterium]MDW8075562.1 phosphoribosyltransferase family protein [Bacteroidota bacterium]MDW8271759.1 phosphoribosyltransferase family protein [Bacteroidota bacterium]
MKVAKALAPFRALGLALLSLFAPWRCRICYAILPDDADNHYLCPACRNQQQAAPPPAALLSRAAQTAAPDECALSLVMACWSADPRLRPGLFDLIRALKYYGYWRIGVELGTEVGRCVMQLSPVRYDAIVPVPIHPARRRERGYNQAEAIAEGVAQVLGCPIWSTVLRRTRHTPSQTQLSASERITNLRNAFGAGKKAAALRDATILIVDDVFTTGATLHSVATAARRYGAARVDAATIIVTQP